MNPSFDKLEQARNEMTGALVGLSRALEGKELTESAAKAMLCSLSLALPCGTSDITAIRNMTETLRREKFKAAPDCASCKSPCGRTDDYDLEEMWNSSDALRGKKFLLLTGLCSVGAAACRRLAQGGEANDRIPAEVLHFLRDGLFLLGYAYEESQLNMTLSKTAEIYLLCI